MKVYIAEPQLKGYTKQQIDFLESVNALPSLVVNVMGKFYSKDSKLVAEGTDEGLKVHNAPMSIG